ncbi:MAG: hypothetical protein WCX93_04635, partial [Burkholderiaceae bacterium]
EVLEVASAGLSPAEQPLLAYARHVQASRRCAADRMLDSWRVAPESAQARLAWVAERHRAVMPAAAYS